MQNSCPNSCNNGPVSENVALTENVPCWIELSSPDVEKSQEFYSAVFGWEFSGSGPMGIGIRALVDGASVAGISQQPAEAPDGQPGFWSLYFRVGNFEEFLEAVADNDGQALMAIPQFDGDASVALVADSGQTGFGVLSYSDDRGFRLSDSVGAPVWFELNTKDTDVTEFYSKVFGWTTSTNNDGYVSFASDGKEIAGMVNISDLQIPSHWKIYIRVEDVDQTLELASQHGGAVLSKPVDTHMGRVAQIIDCHNAAIAIVSK